MTASRSEHAAAIRRVLEEHGHAEAFAALDALVADGEAAEQREECFCGRAFDEHDGECEGVVLVAPGNFAPCECDTYRPAWAHWQERAQDAV